MRLRTVALALALSCGLVTLADAAKTRPAAHKVKPRKVKGQKAPKLKAHKFKGFKRAK